MHADERYAEAERIAARMGFHRLFTQVTAAQRETELAGARVRAARRDRRRSATPGCRA